MHYLISGHLMTWGTLLTAWAEWMRAGRTSPETIRLRVYHLTRLAEAFPAGPDGIDAETLVKWLADHNWKPNTARSYRASYRAFWSWLVKTNRWEGVSPAHEIPTVKVPRAKPRPTPEDAFRQAMRGSTPMIRLAIALAGTGGLRRGEVVRARREDLERDLTGWSLRVVGKGGHVRLVPLTDEIAGMVQACRPGFLFPGPNGHLTPGHLAKRVSRELPDGYTMHTLRHRCGTEAYRATKDLRAVQELLGHAKPETTAIYTAASDSSIRAAMEGAA